MKKTLSFLLVIISIFSLIIISASAISDSDFELYALRCPCGGRLVTDFENVRTSQKVGSCEDHPNVYHYKAYRYKILICASCGDISSESVVATGHYCDCDCGDCDIWCWD